MSAVRLCVVGRDDVAQDVLEHGVALFVDLGGPAAPDRVAQARRRIDEAPTAVGCDDPLGAAIVGVGLEGDIAVGLEFAQEIVDGLLAPRGWGVALSHMGELIGSARLSVGC